eukprot:12502546-Heterocapsa_arctica.AAC.1
MLAAMGSFTPEITGKLPGYRSPSAGLKYADVPHGLAPFPRCQPRAGVSSLPTWPLRDLAGPAPGHCGFQRRLRRQ